MSVNKILLLGNLTRDPELTVAHSGTEICKFTIVTSEKYNDVEKTQFHNCIAFKQKAIAISNHVKKGQQLFVDGKVEYSKYEKNGEVKYFTNIIVNQFSFVGNKSSNGQVSQNQSGQREQNDPPSEDD